MGDIGDDYRLAYAASKELAMLLQIQSVLTNEPNRYFVCLLEKTVIPAVRFGSRYSALVGLRPKPLVKVNGTRILRNTLWSLGAVGFEAVKIVLGHRKHAIQYTCGRRFGPLQVNRVNLSAFDRNGSAYSLLARDALLFGDFCHLEEDVFEQNALCAT